MGANEQCTVSSELCGTVLFTFRSNLASAIELYRCQNHKYLGHYLYIIVARWQITVIPHLLSHLIFNRNECRNACVFNLFWVERVIIVPNTPNTHMLHKTQIFFCLHQISGIFSISRTSRSPVPKSEHQWVIGTQYLVFVVLSFL